MPRTALTSVKAGLGVVLVGFLVSVCHCHVPFVAERARADIREGMTLDVIVVAMRRHEVGRWPLLSCSTEPATDGGFAIDVECVRVIEERVAEGVDFTARVNLLWMGPGFYHNEFDIDLDRHGRVVGVGEVGHWD